jgi:hypothetical protein
VASAAVSLNPCSGAANQVFVPIRGSRLQNPRTKLCLAVRSTSTDPGTRVRLSTCALTAAQRWRLPG